MVMTRNFSELLAAQMDKGKNVCVGLDSDVKKLTEPQFSFNRRIVEATSEVALAYKPNAAFYGGVAGGEALAQTIAFIHDQYPDIPVILDFKRGDIDNTNDGYIDEAFEQLGADAVTVHWYMGLDKGMRPFVDRTDKGIFVLCRTSNKGAAEMQGRLTETYPEDRARWGVNEEFLPMYQVVAHWVLNDWNVNGNCGLVVGATAPSELQIVRQIVGEMPILIPGLGAQEGEAEATVQAGMNSRGQGMIINSSRGIIFADEPGKAANELHRQINLIRHRTRLISDGPNCYQCGNITLRAGAAYVCSSCGATMELPEGIK